MDQVIATPHIATGTLDSLRIKADFYVENIRRIVANQPPVGLIEPN